MLTFAEKSKSEKQGLRDCTCANAATEQKQAKNKRNCLEIDARQMKQNTEIRA